MPPHHHHHLYAANHRHIPHSGTHPLTLPPMITYLLSFVKKVPEGTTSAHRGRGDRRAIPGRQQGYTQAAVQHRHTWHALAPRAGPACGAHLGLWGLIRGVGPAPPLQPQRCTRCTLAPRVIRLHHGGAEIRGPPDSRTSGGRHVCATEVHAP